MDAPTVPYVQNHQDGHGRFEKSNASLCIARNIELWTSTMLDTHCLGQDKK